MHKSRLILLLILFVATGSLAVYQLTIERNTSTITTADRQIAIKDTSAIDQIHITHGKSKLVFTKIRSRWILNGKYRVRTQLLQVLMFGLNQLTVKRPAPNNNNGISALLNQQGSVVDIYDRDQKRTFTMAANPNDLNTAYYLGPGAEPLIVYVPGVKGNLSNLLSLDQADWRSRQLFSVSPADVKKITLTYRDKQRQGFEIDNTGKNPYIQGVANPDNNKINKFLNLIQILSADRFLNSDSLKTTSGQEPDVVMLLELAAVPGRQELKVYYDKYHPNQLNGQIFPAGDAVQLNAQIYKLVFVDKRFFEAK